MVQNADIEKKLKQLLAANMEKIVTAISRDPVKIARKLLAEEIITDTVYRQVAEGHDKGVPSANLATTIQTNAYLTFELDVELLPTFFDILEKFSSKFAAGLRKEYEAIMNHKGIDQRQPQINDETEESDTEKEEIDIDEPVYPMQSMPHGQALIINQLEVEFPVSQRSVSKFKETFNDLGYEVQSHPPLSRDELIDLLQKKNKNNIKKGDDSFVCCIMAHGNKGIIAAKDKNVFVRKLQDAVNGKNCPELFGCPKIFIIYACRGPDPMEPVKVPMEPVEFPTEEEEVALATQLSPMADFYTAYSTPEGYISPIHPTDGCLYLDTLCTVFKEKAKTRSLHQMVTDVNHILEERVTQVTGKGKNIQMGEMTSTLRGSVYFKKV